MDTSSLPTKNNLIRIKDKLKLSRQGHELLEKKKFILTVEKNKYIQKKKQLEQELNDLFLEAYEKLKDAIVDVGIDELIDISEEIKLDNSVSIMYKSVMGVELPTIIYDQNDTKLEYGLYNTKISVDETIIKFNKIKELIVKLAELDNTISRLNKSIFLKNRQ